MINVLLTGDSRVFRGIALNILSIIKYTKCPVHFHIMTIGVPWDKCVKLSKDNFNIIRDTLKNLRPDCEMSYYDISEQFFKTFESSPNKKPIYTPASLTRLFLADVIKCDKLIYLDCDTMACSSLEEFEKLNIDDYEMAATLDFMGHRWIKRDYFNSGVLYINMKKINETKLFQNAIELLKHKKFYFADQTALYKTVKKILYLPRKFNEQRSIKNDTVIKHFNKGIRPFPFCVYNIKQWNVKKVHNFLKIYNFDDIYDEYNKYFSKYEPLIY